MSGFGPSSRGRRRSTRLSCSIGAASPASSPQLAERRGRRPFSPNTGSPNSPDQHSVARLLPRLLRHVYSDAICWLIKCLLGLPIGSPSQQGEGEVNHANLGMPPLGTVSPLSLRTAITGEHALLSPCVDVLLEGGEGASNAADLLCTLCETLPERTDAVELMRSFVPSVTPLLPRVYDAALALDGPKTTSDARIAALKLTSATLRLETRCSGLADEGLSWLPVELLQPDVSDHAVSADSPFARLLAPRLAALRERLLHSKSLQQVQTAELLANPPLDGAQVPPRADRAIRPDRGRGLSLPQE